MYRFYAVMIVNYTTIGRKATWPDFCKTLEEIESYAKGFIGVNNVTECIVLIQFINTDGMIQGHSTYTIDCVTGEVTSNA